MKTLADVDVSGKRIFLRADLDVPLTANSLQLTAESSKQATETAIRLQNLKPTIDYLLEHKTKQIIIAGHIDRPSFTKVTEGKPELYDPKLSTKKLIEELEGILKRSVAFKGSLEIENPEALNSLSQLVLLENLRFWPGEVANDPEFAKKLAIFADVYINEAFGNCHRTHASMVALPALFPDAEGLIEPEGSSEPERPDGVYSRRAAGLHLAREIEELSKVLHSPQRPFVAIVGGAKIETKVPVIENLAKLADQVLVGGELPVEIKASGKSFSENVYVGTLTADNKELSEESAKRFLESISGAATIVWNGPTGVFEEGFDKVSLAIADAIFASGAHSVVGGGETTQFLAMHNLLPKFSFVSSGGGAMLEFLAGKQLPGIGALE